jgi:hypothetical protein
MLSCTFQIASRKHQIDEQGWVDTILSVPINGTVRINTMDWLGQSQYSPTVVFWPVLLDAISKVQILIFPPYRPLQWCISSSVFDGFLLHHQLESWAYQLLQTCVFSAEIGFLL